MPSRGRVIYRRVRDEIDSEEEEEIKRKGKGIMKQEKPLEPQHGPLKGVMIIDVQSSPKRSLSPPPSPPPSKRQKTDKPEEQPAQETEEENVIILTNEELQVGIPSPPRSLDWDLSPLDIQGKAI